MLLLTEIVCSYAQQHVYVINTELFTLFVKGRSQEGKVCQSTRSPSKLKLSDVQLVSGRTHSF